MNTAAATFSVAKSAKLIELAVLKGHCTKLIVAPDQNYTSDCSSQLFNPSYDNGRSGYYFMSTDIIITFSGLGNQQIKQDPDNVIQPIDAIIINHVSKNRPVTLRAVGQCKFANPEKGYPVPVSCTATTEKGKFEAEFMSDGAPPSIVPLR
jgi:hypothetical protein